MDFTAVMPCHVETIFFFTRRQIACVSALLPRQLDTLAIEGERTGRMDGVGGRNLTWFSPFSRGMRRTSNRFWSVIDHMPVNYGYFF